MDDLTLAKHIATELGYRLDYEADYDRFKVWRNDEYLDWFPGPDADKAWEAAFTELMADSDYIDGPRYGSTIPRWPWDEGAAIRLCVEIMRERDYELRMYYGTHADGHPMICADFYAPEFQQPHADEWVDEYVATAPTPARALALLALRALGGEDAPDSGAGGSA